MNGHNFLIGADPEAKQAAKELPSIHPPIKVAASGQTLISISNLRPLFTSPSEGAKSNRYGTPKKKNNVILLRDIFTLSTTFSSGFLGWKISPAMTAADKTDIHSL